MSKYQREITAGAADAYLRRLTKTGRRIDLTAATAVEITFENTESIRLRPESIKTLWVSGKQADRFYLRLTANEASVLDAHTFDEPKLAEPGLQRLQSFQDVTAITVDDGATQQVFSVHWSDVSAFDEENLAQHLAYVDDDLVLCAWLPSQYPMSEVVAAARYTENRLVMLSWLEADEALLHGHAPEFLDDVLAELQSFAGLAEYKDQHLIVRYDPNGEDDDPWEPVYRIAGDDTDYGGVELLSYAELMGMDVKVEGPDFWSGFASLLWWLTFEGVEANQREVAIARFHAELKASEEETQAFHAATAKMQRFLNWYAQHDADASAVVAKYQPLTAGVQETISGLDMTVEEQDESLLADFMQTYGELYQRFE